MKDPSFQFSIDRKTLDTLAAYADARNVTISALVRSAVYNFVNNITPLGDDSDSRKPRN